MTIAQSLNSKLENFELKREQIETKLEFQIRHLVNENKEESARNALSLSQLTLRTSIIDSLIEFAFIGGLLYTINLWIVSPILELVAGIQNFASGNYDMKINIKSEDEIGDLAFAFNDMTNEIEEKIETITENEKKLEALNKDLEKEIQTRKEYEKEIIRVARESEVDRLRSQFLSTITHELRTPLTSIKGYIEVIRSGWVGEVSAEMNDTLDIIERNSDRLSSLTSDLLDVQRIASGRLEVDLSIIDLKDVIEQSVKEINPEIAEKKQVLKLEIPKEPFKTMGDSQRLNQVLLNLLNNASKFSKEESTIYLKVETDDEKILVSIKDSGIGIKKADVERVFTPLAMIEKPVYVKGTGLGLSISKGIIDLHNGEIWAESEGEWKGSKFTIQLPKKEEP
jgi:signal transduction histidine kinase